MEGGNTYLSLGGEVFSRPGRKKNLESNLQGVLAQQLNGGRWGSEGSSYVEDGQERSRRLGCCADFYSRESSGILHALTASPLYYAVVGTSANMMVVGAM